MERRSIDPNKIRVRMQTGEALSSVGSSSVDGQRQRRDFIHPVTRQLLRRCGHLKAREQLHVARRAPGFLDLQAPGPIDGGKFGPLLLQCVSCPLLLSQAAPVARRRGRLAATTGGQVVARYIIRSRQEQSRAHNGGR